MWIIFHHFVAADFKMLIYADHHNNNTEIKETNDIIRIDQHFTPQYLSDLLENIIKRNEQTPNQTKPVSKFMCYG